MTAYDKNGFRILFHFAKECPPGRPDVLVVVVSMLNTAPLPIKSIVLQAAVPKVPWLLGLLEAGITFICWAAACVHSRHLPSLQRASLFLFSQ